MKELVMSVINDLYWESKQENDPVWNYGEVTPEMLTGKLSALGYEVSLELSEFTDEEYSYRRAGERDSQYTPAQQTGVLVVNGENVPVIIFQDWHGNINSGYEYQDIQVQFEE